MNTNSAQVGKWLVATSLAGVLILGLVSLDVSQWQFWALLAALLPAGATLFLRGSAVPVDSELQRLRAEAEQQKLQWKQQSDEMDAARAELMKEVEIRANDLVRREQDLAARFAKFQEFLEYPSEDLHAGRSTEELHQLTEQDRQVRRLLEAEAERVYEKIRTNGYTVNGKVDLITIRDEALHLIQQVAKIYKPGAETPILDTSLEQLARAASRIWLHLLVLLEQLPMNVQQYNIATLYGYIRKAVIGYGVYQKAGPWMTYLTRGLYAGRIAAATNPASLGAWWLATELGKQGAKKAIEHVVDKQAVALLHQVITVVGVEAANIYAPGFRQRDPAWIEGAELVELISSFPASGDSLRHGLKRITALPLRCEYDRIYLYRCLATHRSVGLHLAEPSMLTRPERETIAHSLEQFFDDHIHGATDAALKAWREGVEHRFDLRLKLDGSHAHVTTQRTDQLLDAASSLCSFLKYLVQPEPSILLPTLKALRIGSMLSEDQKQKLQRMELAGTNVNFEPPGLDPASDITESYLKDLATCCTATNEPAEELEQLVLEACSYFRRTPAEGRQWLNEAWKLRLKEHCSSPDVFETVSGPAARGFFLHREPDDRLVMCYGGLSLARGNHLEELSDCWLLGVENSAGGRRLVLCGEAIEPLKWSTTVPVIVERIKGMFVDDARIPAGASSVCRDSLQISGSLRGGRFRSYFERLLNWSQTPTQT
jgi:hypothetical protein